jgi:hypothetical protein
MRAAAGLLWLAICLSASGGDLLLRNVTVVDVKTGIETPDLSILIHGSRIAAIGDNPRAPRGAKTIDASGKYVIPGLWNMHAHLPATLVEFERLPRDGITGLRDMGSDPEHATQWRDQVEKGRLLGPHIESCVSPIGGPSAKASRFPMVTVRTPEEARTAYDQLDARRPDFIAVTESLPRDAYFALIERARKWKSPVAGEVPVGVRAEEAIEARQASVDGLSAILAACSMEGDRLVQLRARAFDKGDWFAFGNFEAKLADSFSEQRADALFGRMTLLETRVVPMLAREESSRALEIVGRMHRAGVLVLAGGDGVHRELEAQVAAGFSPLEALRSATIEPARFLQADESLGSIEEGKIADIVLLDADPLADVGNTRKIAGAIVGGRYVVGK